MAVSSLCHNASFPSGNERLHSNQPGCENEYFQVTIFAPEFFPEFDRLRHVLAKFLTEIRPTCCYPVKRMQSAVCPPTPNSIGKSNVKEKFDPMPPQAPKA